MAILRQYGALMPTPTTGGTTFQYLQFDDNTDNYSWATAVRNLGDLLDADTTTTAPTNNDVLTFNGTNWVPSASAAVYTFNITDGTTTEAIASGNTVTFNSSNLISSVVTATDTVSYGIDTAASTNGQVIKSDGAGAVSWQAPISIAAGSSAYASFNTATGELSLSALAITRVVQNATETSLANYVTNVYAAGNTDTLGEGDVLILTAATGGTEVYIHNGGSSNTATDFTLIEISVPTVAIGVVGDTGTNQSLDASSTLTLTGGTNISTVASNTDTITFNWAANIADLTDIPAATTGGTTTQLLQFDDNTDTFSWVDSTTIGFEGLTLAGDSGANQPIVDNDIITIAGGTNIATVAGVTDTITINWSAAISDLSNIPALPGTAGNYLLDYNQTTDTFTWIANTASLDWTKEAFTATAGQTAFTVAGGSLPANSARIIVSRNGVELYETSGFTYVAGTGVVTLVTAANVNDVIQIRHYA